MHRIVLFMACYWYLFIIHLEVAFSIPETYSNLEVRQVFDKFHMPYMYLHLMYVLPIQRIIIPPTRLHSAPRRFNYIPSPGLSEHAS